MKIDINCDVGEGINNEHLLMPYISSCNISCGAHAGSIDTIDKVIALAKSNNVKIGAHPSFPDRENFGRKIMSISDADLQQSIENQLILLKERAELQKVKVNHVKPHGALYNLIAVDEQKAELVVTSIKNVFENVKIYVPYNSKVEDVAKENGLEIVYEVFADRNYNDDLTLVSRNQVNAIIDKPNDVLNHVLKIVNEGKVKTVSGKEIVTKANTFCIHGDHKNSVSILEHLHQKMKIE
ncbi:UPF0271 protein [Lutibacter sp. Hel_I_33_5]|uniref:5-oxoprolinase subunit PxpA n=1 Tax=Lutibacter sp. Hel_I_33_5 TaxID=1566289 RepID=UPI0011A69509|nr:5-oxoprolinase subunit PxpA [Lutibacter sp. Hel_I_33_5]TVZ55905.1 UPF0271 protein [Lutibacter sp. Hel_I_33_5]